MIFYFTGTGNSWYAAKAVLGENEELINITECVKNKQYSFTLEENEAVGIVFPVYFCGVPSIVNHFVKRLAFNCTPAYFYTLITCGSWTGDAANQMNTLLGKANLSLDAAFSVAMPDNYALMYDTPNDKEIKEALEKADVKLLEIREKIGKQEWTKIESNLVGKMMTKTLFPMYVNGRKTAPFHVDERCVGCGVCASRCPIGAIEMKDGVPTWVKDRCVLCMACARCNAIQYDDRMKEHRRYVNPEYKYATSCH